jgi:hypothetical protein
MELLSAALSAFVGKADIGHLAMLVLSGVLLYLLVDERKTGKANAAALAAALDRNTDGNREVVKLVDSLADKVIEALHRTDLHLARSGSRE